MTLILYFKYWLTTLWGGVAKGNAGKRAPEDRSNNQAPTAEDHLLHDRTARVVMNDIENLPIGLTVLWGTFVAIWVSQPSIAGINTNNTTNNFDYNNTANYNNPHKLEKYWDTFIAFCIIFACARFLHKIIYSAALPHFIRTFFYLIGVLAILGSAILAVIAAFQ